MSKPRLAIFAQELVRCSCFDTIFNTEFQTEAAETVEQFLSSIENSQPDAAVVCFCSAHEKNAEELLAIDALSGPLPVLTCSKSASPDFVRAVAPSV